jgi:methionyl-tRNA formyltransferase
MAKILLCIATEKGLESLRAATDCADPSHLLVCTFTETGVVESFHEQIAATARAVGIQIATWGAFRENPVGFIRSNEIGSILCVGWRYLIPEPAIRELESNVVVAHDSLLPKHRGFAPLVTAMIAGDSQTGVTFFRVGTAVDNGDVFWQGKVTIERHDTIGSLIRKTLPLYREGVLRFCRGEFRDAAPQDESQATYSIWRDSDDYYIDWSQEAEFIERSVRALGTPYSGARTFLGGKVVVLQQVEVVADLPFSIRQPGKVWALDKAGNPTVVCGKGMLKICAAMVDGKTVLPLNALRLRFDAKAITH